MNEWIPVSRPAFLGNEERYVRECMESTWISSIGEFIVRFEKLFAETWGVEEAISCCNGTVALHLALLGLGLKPGDEVLVPSLTYVASANAITYVGATPVFVDSDRDTWNLSVEDLRRKITARAKAIMVVHLYGRPAPIEEICALAKEHGLWVIEDVAEAPGAKVNGRMLGTFGDVAAFSFFGNKILTCGEGGMVLAANPERARAIRQLKGQGQDFDRRYWFPVIGYNYRMTNIQAAIGLAQLERFEEHLARRAEIEGWYRDSLVGSADIILAERHSEERSVCWLFSLVLGGLDEGRRDKVISTLAAGGVDSRPFFYPCHSLPPFAGDLGAADQCATATWLAARGVSLPTWIGLRQEQVARVVGSLQAAIADAG